MRHGVLFLKIIAIYSLSLIYNSYALDLKLKYDNFNVITDCGVELDIKYCDIKCQLCVISYQAIKVQKVNRPKFQDYIHCFSRLDYRAFSVVDLLHSPHVDCYRKYISVSNPSDSRNIVGHSQYLINNQHIQRSNE